METIKIEIKQGRLFINDNEIKQLLQTDDKLVQVVNIVDKNTKIVIG